MATALELVRLLADRHSSDVFVPECKNGTTWFADHFRLDAWAMKKSWKQPNTYGYEIKVSRSDFLQDGKWRNYLPLCSDFYFVTPQGLIQRDEVPPEAGWLEASKNAKRLFTRKKAPTRDVEIPDSLFRYILMSRVKVTRERHARERVDELREYLSGRAERKEFGRVVAEALAEDKQAYVKRVEAENRRLAGLMSGYDSIRRCLEAHGIDPDNVSSYATYGVERRIKELRQVVPPELVQSLRAVRDTAGRAIDSLEGVGS